MKTFLTLLLILSLGLAAETRGKTFRKAAFSTKAARHTIETATPGELQPKATGAFHLFGEIGGDAINPFAPESAGSGQDNITEKLADEGDRSNEDRKPYGGLILIGFEF